LSSKFRMHDIDKKDYMGFENINATLVEKSLKDNKYVLKYRTVGESKIVLDILLTHFESVKLFTTFF